MPAKKPTKRLVTGKSAGRGASRGRGRGRGRGKKRMPDATTRILNAGARKRVKTNPPSAIPATIPPKLKSVEKPGKNLFTKKAKAKKEAKAVDTKNAAGKKRRILAAASLPKPAPKAKAAKKKPLSTDELRAKLLANMKAKKKKKTIEKKEAAKAVAAPEKKKKPPKKISANIFGEPIEKKTVSKPEPKSKPSKPKFSLQRRKPGRSVSLPKKKAEEAKSKKDITSSLFPPKVKAPAPVVLKKRTVVKEKSPPKPEPVKQIELRDFDMEILSDKFIQNAEKTIQLALAQLGETVKIKSAPFSLINFKSICKKEYEMMKAELEDIRRDYNIKQQVGGSPL